MPELGLYVHFPWCRSRCPYCDFAIAVAPLGEIPHRAWADAVLEELALRAPLFPGRRLVSIYFGGGTPALWDPAEIGRVIAAARATFTDAVDEITVEANPLDCTPETLAGLRAAGASRLSIGTQGFRDEDLVTLGRDHDARAARTAVAAARAAGFAQVSLDLIYAMPGLELAAWRRTLETALALAPDHLSVYQLTIESRTTFGEAARRGKLAPIPDDVAAEQFELADELLGAAGYQHYEVSAYARPGARARHNSLYWHGAEYLGIGNGAHSFWRPDEATGVRWAAHRSAKRWLAAAPDAVLERDARIAEITRQDAAELASDAVWLAVRTSDGVPAASVDAAGAARCEAAGLLVRDGERLRPTRRGLLLADAVGVELIR